MPDGDIWDAAAARQGSTATAPPQDQDDGDVWDQAAKRPIPQAPDLGQSPQQGAGPEDLGVPKLDTSVIPGLIPGALKSAGKAITSVADVANKVLPQPISNAIGTQAWRSPEMRQREELAPPTTSEGLGENLGAMGEMAGEFALFDMLGGAGELTTADKIGEMGKIWKAVELHPQVKKALQLGMSAVKQGAIGAGIAKAHGADTEDSLELGAFGAVAGFGAGEGVEGASALGKRFMRARENSYIQMPEDYVVRAFNPPEEVNLPKADQDQAVREFSKFDQEFKANAPYILGTAERTGLHPVGRKSMIDLTLRTADEFHDLWNNRILGPRETFKVGMPAGFQGKSDGGFTTLRDLDTRLNIINDTLSPRYEAGKGGVTAEAKVGAEQATELRTEAAQIRKLLYGTLQQEVGDKIGVNVSEIKARNGQLRDLADNMSRQWQKQRTRGFEPVGDSSTVRSATEKGVVKLSRSVLGDPRDRDVRTGWQLLRNDLEPMSVGEMGPSLPPPKTNAFVSRSHTVKIDPDKAATFTWGRTSPEDIAAHQQRINERVERNTTQNEKAKQQAAQNKASHGPTRGQSDATGEP